MKTDLAGLTALMIAGAGLLIAVAGGLAWFWRDNLAAHMRYVLPVPPLGVAAYVFVISLIKDRPDEIGRAELMREIAVGAAAAAIVFAVFSSALLLLQRFGR